MQKYSVKLILREAKKNSEGLAPVYLRITINRQPRFISTGHYIPARLWDKKNERVKKGHLIADEINLDITNRKQQVIRQIVNEQVSGESVTSQQIKRKVTARASQKNFFDFTDTFIEQVKNKRQKGTLSNYAKHTKKLLEYHGSRSLTFEQMDQEYLTAYENHLHESVGVNYITALFKTIRTIFNAARRQGVTQHYPFAGYENPVYSAPGKEYLTLEELTALEELKTTNVYWKESACWFLLGSYSGLRISDWKKFDKEKHVKNGRVYLRATKNKEWITMPVSSGLSRILEKLPPLTMAEQHINRTLKDIMRHLRIHKKITTHCARHTFAITICAERGISSETCAELMGITVDTCVQNYYKVTNRKIDIETLKAWANL